MIESSKALRPWRRHVTETVTQALGDWKLTKDPIKVRINFELQRPESVSNPKRKSWREHPTVKPDVDKLARAILDSLTGVVYVDDSQVIKLTVEKRYVEAAPTTTITVENLIDQVWH
jgi:Holliday junction resolvase RusA-like endonuclease